MSNWWHSFDCIASLDHTCELGAADRGKNARRTNVRTMIQIISRYEDV